MLTAAQTQRRPREPKNNRAVQMARADCCRLLAACFYPPDAKLFAREGLTDKLGALLKIACTGASPLVPPLQAHLKHENDKQLSVAYTRLFLGPPEVLAPPYASFYLDKGGTVMGPSSVAIEALYDSAGLALDNDFQDMPDHVVVMLEFLYYLIFREALAEDSNEFQQKENLKNIRIHFLKNYIFTWIPEFCLKITEAETHPFYTGLAQCLDTFIQCGFATREVDHADI